MIRPYFGSHFVLKRPVPQEPTQTKFMLKSPVFRHYEAVPAPGGGYNEITSILDEKDPIVKTYLDGLGIEYDVTASAKDYLTLSIKQGFPDAQDAEVERVAEDYIAECRAFADVLERSR